MHLKVGHGHEERIDMKGYVVFIPKKYSEFAVGLWKNKMAQNGRFQFF